MGINAVMEKSKKTLSIVLALVLTLSLIGISALTSAKTALAESVQMSVGREIYYAGWSTNQFSIGGNLGYCIRPWDATPPNGSYTVESPYTEGGYTVDQLRSALWYSYGGPGFEEVGKQWFPSTWYDGTAMTPDRYMVLSHILLADVFTSDGGQALGGTEGSEAFRYYALHDVIGVWRQDNGDFASNPNSAERKFVTSEFVKKVPKNFKVHIINSSGNGTQPLIYAEPWEPLAAIEVTKVSKNPSLTDDNKCYTLAGAEFAVFDTEAKAKTAILNQSATGALAINENGDKKLVTDKNGKAKTEEIFEAGDYWVAEIKPSDGFALPDSASNPQKVTVAPRDSDTAAVTFKEPPKNDPPGIILKKTDDETNELMLQGAIASPQGSAMLSGAEFKVLYFDDMNVTAANYSSKTPKRQWTFKTDSDGFVYFVQSYKVRGDDIYTTENGTPTFPLGTVVIYESKAPTGYNLGTIGANGQLIAPPVNVIKISDNTVITEETVTTYNDPLVKETVKRGNLELVKGDLDFVKIKEDPASEDYYLAGGDDNIPEGDAKLNGAEFEVINFNTNSVVSPQYKDDDGNPLLITKGDVVCTIVTDEEGYAATNKANLNGWTMDSKYHGMALPVGKYIIRESKPPEGYVWNKTWRGLATITEEGQMVHVETTTLHE